MFMQVEISSDLIELLILCMFRTQAPIRLARHELCLAGSGTIPKNVSPAASSCSVLLIRS